MCHHAHVSSPPPPHARRPVGTSGPYRRPPALVTSVVLGAAGTFLLLAGLVLGSEPALLSALVAGTASLVAVLVWREQLIAAWRRDHPRSR